MCEINKSNIKKFVREVVHLVRGLAAHLAEDYGVSETTMSNILNETNEMNGYFYPSLLFMKRVAKHSPEAHAMLDDEWRRINDEIRGDSQPAIDTKNIDDLLQTVNTAHFKLMRDYRNRCGRGALKAQAAMLQANLNNLLKKMDADAEREKFRPEAVNS